MITTPELEQPKEEIRAEIIEDKQRSEAEEKTIFKEVGEAEYRAFKVADTKYPMDGNIDPEITRKHIEMIDELESKYKQTLKEKYGLSSDELSAITSKGVKNRWEFGGDWK